MGKAMRVMRISWGGYTNRGYFWEYMWAQAQMKAAELMGFQSMLAHALPSIPTHPSAAMEVATNLVREVRALSMRGVPVEYVGAEFGRVVEVLLETGEVAKAAALVLAREAIDKHIKPISAQLASGGSGRGLGKLEVRLRELVGLVTSILASEFPIPKDVVPEGALRGEYEVVGGYVVVKNPFNLKDKITKQVPKGVLDDKDLIEVLILWLNYHGANAFFRWLVTSPGDAVLYNSISQGLLPGTFILLMLHILGISPSQLNWEGLINELDRLDEKIKRVKAQIKGAKDKGEKAKLKEELERLKSERELVAKALFAWTDAMKALKAVLQENEWVSIYNLLPERVRIIVDASKKPKDSFEEFLKKDGMKIMALADKERRRSKAWVSIDGIGEARERLRKYVPMLDRLIEPAMAGLINEVAEGINTVLNKLGGAESARDLLRQALDRLGNGDLDGAINAARAAIEDLRDAAIKEDGMWIDGLLSDVGRLNELINELAMLNALNRLVK